MATCCIPRDPLTWFIVRARRVLFSACTVALVSCGGGQSAPTAPVDSVGPTGADTTDGPSITLNPPTTVGESNRLEVTWQAQGDLTSFTVCVQRATGVGFETVDAIIGSNSAQFERGAAYRLDFPTARVRVRGCNDAGQCVESNEQPLLDALLGGLAENTAQYGLSQVALSADGNTLAVFAGAGDPNNPTTPGTGAVIVFHRTEDGQWSQEAMLERFAVPGSLSQRFALSGDGNTVVIGAPDDSGTVGGINPPEEGAVGGPGDRRGAIHVFTRDAQHQWSRQAFIKPAVPLFTPLDNRFGSNTAVSHDGNRVLVAANNTMYLFERTNGQWRQARIFETGSGVVVVPVVDMAISADGRTIAVAGGTFATRGRLAVLVYKECACSEGWLLAAELPSLRAFPNFEVFDTDHFGESLSLSGDGNVLAVGAPRDPGDLPCDGPFSAGAVYIFAADSSGVWQRRAFLQGRTVVPSDQLGGEVALSADGKVLVAKACGFAANAQGLRRNHRAGATVGPTTPDPGEDTTTCQWGGSGYVFEADAGDTWSHTAAAIAGPGERVVFGDFSLAMSADAQTVALSASSIRPQTPPVERFSRVVVY